MIELGIFGDSFAHQDNSKIGTSYIEYIDENENISVTSYGFSGSSLYYSYNIFKEEHHKYDKVIFFITHPARLYIPNTENNKVANIYSLSNAEYLIKNENLSGHDKKIVNAVIDFYKYIFNQDEYRVYHFLMCEDIKRIRNDVLLIDCFGFNDTCFVKKQLNMFDVALLDKMEDDTPISSIRGIDCRMNHMNYENNKIFSEKILEWISTGVFNFSSIEDFTSTVGIREFYNKL